MNYCTRDQTRRSATHSCTQQQIRRLLTNETKQEDALHTTANQETSHEQEHIRKSVAKFFCLSSPKLSTSFDLVPAPIDVIQSANVCRVQRHIEIKKVWIRKSKDIFSAFWINKSSSPSLRTGPQKISKNLKRNFFWPKQEVTIFSCLASASSHQPWAPSHELRHLISEHQRSYVTSKGQLENDESRTSCTTSTYIWMKAVFPIKTPPRSSTAWKRSWQIRNRKPSKKCMNTYSACRNMHTLKSCEWREAVMPVPIASQNLSLQTINPRDANRPRNLMQTQWFQVTCVTPTRTERNLSRPHPFQHPSLQTNVTIRMTRTNLSSLARPNQLRKHAWALHIPW